MAPIAIPHARGNREYLGKLSEQCNSLRSMDSFKLLTINAMSGTACLSLDHKCPL
jgi:hypothetical protein